MYHATIQQHEGGATSEQLGRASYTGGELTSHLYTNPNGTFGWEIRDEAGIGIEGTYEWLDEGEARSEAAEQLRSYAHSWSQGDPE